MGVFLNSHRFLLLRYEEVFFFEKKKQKTFAL